MTKINENKFTESVLQSWSELNYESMSRIDLRLLISLFANVAAYGENFEKYFREFFH